MSGSECPRMGQNIPISGFWAKFIHFHLTEIRRQKKNEHLCILTGYTSPVALLCVLNFPFVDHCGFPFRNYICEWSYAVDNKYFSMKNNSMKTNLIQFEKCLKNGS